MVLVEAQRTLRERNLGTSRGLPIEDQDMTE